MVAIQVIKTMKRAWLIWYDEVRRVLKPSSMLPRSLWSRVDTWVSACDSWRWRFSWMREWTSTMTIKSPPDAIRSMPLTPRLFTDREVTTGPTTAPRLPPAVMAGRRREAWVGVNTSTMRLQKTEIMKRFTTLNHQ